MSKKYFARLRLLIIAVAGILWLAGPSVANNFTTERVDRAKKLFIEVKNSSETESLSVAQRLLAQWGNWGNWGNWNNWNDWNRWRDWGNGWTNFVNG